MKKLAIVNGAPSSEMLAPFDDPEWEIWVLGNRHNRYPRFDRVFEIHDDLSEHGDGLEYANMLLNLGKPLVVGEGFPLLSLDLALRSGGDKDLLEVFPFDEAKELFGRTYLTSSTVYMIAYAMLHGYEYIRLFGVDMAVDEHEYFWQRPCLEAWLGFAKGKGIDIDVHESSPVFKSDYVEGLGCGGRPDFSCEPFTSKSFEAVADKHRKAINDAQGQIDALTAKIHTHHGAIQAYDRMRKVARAVEMGQKVENIEREAVIK